MEEKADKKIPTETIRSTIPNSPDGTKSIEFPEPHQQEQAQKQQPEPSDFLGNDIIDNIEETSERKAKSPESEWVISIRQKLDPALQDNLASSWVEHCIYRIPHYLIQGEETTYFPRIVSLGPYHHGKEHLRQMEDHKWRALYQLLKRNNQDIRLYLDSIRELEEKARRCYEETISLSSDEFVEMMVLDGCFVLEIFMGVAEGFEQLGYSRNDPIFTYRVCAIIRRDLIMLENQLPLFILERLLELQFDNADPKGHVAELATIFLYPMMPTVKPLLEYSLGHKATFDPSADEVGLHCLDVFRRSLLRAGPERVERCPQNNIWLRMIHCLDVFRRSLLRAGPEPVEQCPQNKSWLRMIHCLDVFRRILLRARPKPDAQCPQNNGFRLIRCVKELREAGVKFKKSKTDQLCDVKFENGVLSMPRLAIQDSSKSLFLNLIAFEQSHLDCGNDITAYVLFMDNLINSPEDVAYLHYNGIIEHLLGSDAEVANLFNSLGRDVVVTLDDPYLSPLIQHINSYCDNRWNTWRASLNHNYFRNPWTFISLVAAVVLLLLTLAQTFYSVYGYHRPPS